PLGGVAAAKSLLQLSAVKRVMQAESKSANVAKFAIVGVWLPLSGSGIASPQLPVSRLTKCGTLPAVIFKPSALPLIASSSRNCACVHTEAIVVISLTITVGGILLPSTARKAMLGFSPPAAFAEGLPPFATK